MRYGVFATGNIFGINSILKLMSLMSCNRGNSFGNTSLIVLTQGGFQMDLRFPPIPPSFGLHITYIHLCCIASLEVQLFASVRLVSL